MAALSNLSPCGLNANLGCHVTKWFRKELPACGRQIYKPIILSFLNGEVGVLPRYDIIWQQTMIVCYELWFQILGSGIETTSSSGPLPLSLYSFNWSAIPGHFIWCSFMWKLTHGVQEAFDILHEGLTISWQCLYEYECFSDGTWKGRIRPLVQRIPTI